MRTLFIILFTFALSTSAMAQFRYGVQLGGEFSRPTGSAHADGGNGFSGGLEAEYSFSTDGGAAIDIAVLYQRRNLDTHGAADTLGRDYIAVPVDVRYQLLIPAVRQLAGIYLFTGADLAWRVDRGVSKRFHPGWRIGAGVSIIDFIRLSGGYRLGLNEVVPGVRDSGAFVAASVMFNI